MLVVVGSLRKAWTTLECLALFESVELRSLRAIFPILDFVIATQRFKKVMVE